MGKLGLHSVSQSTGSSSDQTASYGPGVKNANWFGYGAEILAVADAVVASVNDAVPENKPDTESRAVPITLETIGANYVILDLGNGRYAMYLHMQPGKIRVKAGDKVRRGQVLGLVGNSGNSDGPHLHFEICDADSPLGSEGLPFVFESFEKLGRGELSDNAASWASWKPLPNGKVEERRMEIPRCCPLSLSGSITTRYAYGRRVMAGGLRYPTVIAKMNHLLSDSKNGPREGSNLMSLVMKPRRCH